MDAYTLELKKLLANNEVKEVMNSLIETLDEAARSTKELKEEIEPLQGKIIILSSRFSKAVSEREQDFIDAGDFNTQMARINKTLVDILNSLDDEYPILEKYFNEQTEEKAWAIASASNDIEGYQDYFQKYPNGKYKEETQRLIRELQAIEGKKKEEFRKKAEAEKRRRQSVQARPQTRTSNVRYYLMGAGLLAFIGLGYFLVKNFNEPPAERKRTEVATTQVEEATEEPENPNPRNPGNSTTDTKEPDKPDNPDSRNPGGTLTLDPGNIKPELLERLPDLVETGKIPVDQLIKSPASSWQGTWKTSFDVLRLKTSGNRVYGDYGKLGTIEGYYDPNSQTLKGEFVNGTREGTFKWTISGENMGGNWSFNDAKTQGRWTGSKTSSRMPSLQNFPWEGIWDTAEFGEIEFSQKSNKVSGKGDKVSIYKASYDARNKRLEGILTDGRRRTTADFSITISDGKYFKGKWAYTKTIKGVKSSGIWEGKRIK